MHGYMVYVSLCVCVSVCVCGSVCACVSEDYVGPSGTGVIDRCELPLVGDEPVSSVRAASALGH